MARLPAIASSVRYAILCGLLLVTGSRGYVRFCYFTNWAQFRPNETSFTPADIDPALCTHVLFAFAKIANNSILPIENNDVTLYQELVSLRKVNPRLKVLLSIGGWEANNTEFSSTVSNQSNINEFAKNSLVFLKKHKFDGLDLDWEYPAGRGGPRQDRARFTTLLQTLRSSFNDDAELTKSPTMLLSAAVVAGINQANKYYQIDKIGSYVDYINVMAFDFHGSWETRTGLHCALYNEVDDSINGWINAGAPPSKITMGIAAFGRTYTLASDNPIPTNFGLNQPITGAGAPGKYTQASGKLAYFEVCKMVQTLNWTETFSATHSSPMAYGLANGGMNWVGYDNVLSVRQKARVIREKGLAGSLLWTLDQDDFLNTCGDNAFPLANALLEQLPSDGEVDDSTPNDPGWVTTTPEPTTTLTVRTQPTTGAPPSRRPTIKIPNIPFYRINKPLRCRLRVTNAGPLSLIQGNPRLYVAKKWGIIGIICECFPNFVFNPCRKECDFKTNRATCPIFF